ncbi:MAG TPA: hypothetical protein ENH19_02080 [Actinobacteria bacterium]|nr:hypothetical protein [Actinomycetes bacterium]HEX21425.1 hypothetical protein [Actinomycetota bacterium]
MKRRLSGLQRARNYQASRKAQQKRKVLRILALIKDLEIGIKELDSLNCAPVRYPNSSSKSIIYLGSRSNPAEEDKEINRLFEIIETDLIIRVQDTRKVAKKKR